MNIFICSIIPCTLILQVRTQCCTITIRCFQNENKSAGCKESKYSYIKKTFTVRFYDDKKFALGSSWFSDLNLYILSDWLLFANNFLLGLGCDTIKTCSEICYQYYCICGSCQMEPHAKTSTCIYSFSG